MRAQDLTAFAKKPGDKHIKLGRMDELCLGAVLYAVQVGVATHDPGLNGLPGEILYQVKQELNGSVVLLLSTGCLEFCMNAGWIEQGHAGQGWVASEAGREAAEDHLGFGGGRLKWQKSRTISLGRRGR